MLIIILLKYRRCGGCRWVLYDGRNTCDRALETHTRDRDHARSDGHVPADRRRRGERLATVRNAREILRATTVPIRLRLSRRRKIRCSRSTERSGYSRRLCAGGRRPYGDRGPAPGRHHCGDRRRAAALSRVSGTLPPVKLAHKNGHKRANKSRTNTSNTNIRARANATRQTVDKTHLLASRGPYGRPTKNVKRAAEVAPRAGAPVALPVASSAAATITVRWVRGPAGGFENSRNKMLLRLLPR